MGKTLGELTFVSGSRNKFDEYRALLPEVKLEWAEYPFHEPQHLSLEVIVREKVDRYAESHPDARFFVEHTGILIDAWSGLPGGLTSVFMDTVGNEGLCRMLRAYTGSARSSRARVVIGYRNPRTGYWDGIGEVGGTIAPSPRGPGGFGWDPIFIPEGQQRTYAEMTAEEKNADSMRVRAARQLRKHLLEEPPDTVELMLSYAREDEKLKNSLLEHLKGLEGEGLVSAWHDRELMPGSAFDDAIDERLHRSRIILLLVSPSFVASQYIQGKELKRAIERHDNKQAVVVPVILRPTENWQTMSFGRLTAVPKDGRPVTRSRNRAAALEEVVGGIRRVVESLRAG